MSLYILSLVAGILTVLAPCVLPILPVIIWGSVIDGKKSRPRLIILAFAISIIIFTLWLQFLVSQFWVKPKTLTYISAYILILFWIFLLFPKIRAKFMSKTWIEKATHDAQSHHGSGFWWDILLGFILWPIFNTCSPTYAILVGNVLPADFVTWMIHILLYVIWLSAILLAIAYWWRSVVNKMKRAANPNWWFKKVIAWILILLWVSIVMWWDKDVETWLIQNWLYIDTTNWEIDQVKDLEELN